MSMRGFMKRMSMAGGLHPDIAEDDRVRWNAERAGLLQSQLQPAQGEPQLLPPSKSALELGAAVPVPPLTALRLTHSTRQYVIYNGNLKAQMLGFEGIELFAQPFQGARPLPTISRSNSLAFHEAVSMSPPAFHGRLRSTLLLFDWEFVPADVDSIFVGAFSPANYLHPDQQFASSGLLEIMDLEEIDPDYWCKSSDAWPQWDMEKNNYEQAQLDLLKAQPSFFDKRDIYATYLCKEETGFAKCYVWGRFDRVVGTSEWEFLPIRQAILADRVPKHIPFLKKMLGAQSVSLKYIAGRTIHFHTQDPLAKMEVQCYRFDRFGFLLGDPIIHNQVTSRGRLDLDLDASVNGDYMTRFWLVWTGESDTFVSLQIDEEDPIDFMGDQHCILGRFSCLGSSQSLFPTPKTDAWMFYTVFEKLEDRDPLSIIRESQGYAQALSVKVISARDLQFGRPIVQVTQGEHLVKSKKAEGEPPVWNTEWLWGIDDSWREGNNRQITFEVFSKKFVSSAPGGMAIYELDSMRIPYCGDLRLRPTGTHATKRAGGTITVNINVQSTLLDE